MIEAGADMKREGEKEWYFGNADKERLGPYSIEEMTAFWNDGTIHAKTRCWAQVRVTWTCSYFGVEILHHARCPDREDT